MQWHPEVNRFQWDRELNFPHSRHAVQLSSLLAEFFTNEGNGSIQANFRAVPAPLRNPPSPVCLRLGRRSLHHFEDPEEEASSLIYNYTPVYGVNISKYEQIYFF